MLRRSVLTEKIARRGLHVSREHSVDPLEVLFVHEVMSSIDYGSKLLGEQARGRAVYADDTLRHVAYAMAEAKVTEMQVRERGAQEQVIGRVTLEQLLKARLRDLHEERHSERVLTPRELIGWRS